MPKRQKACLPRQGQTRTTPASSTSTAPTSATIRFAAVGDLHCSKTSAGALRPFFAQAAEAADALLLCGDLTDYGTPEEAHVLAGELAAAAAIPIVAVLGNHDFESDQADAVMRILSYAGVVVLDGDA